MVTIGLDQFLSNSSLYEHRCLEILGSYTNLLENFMTNRSIGPSLKKSWYPLLRDLRTSVKCMRACWALQIIQDKESLLVYFWHYWMSNEKLLSADWDMIKKKQGNQDGHLVMV